MAEKDTTPGQPLPLPRPTPTKPDREWTLSEEARRDIEEIESATIRW